ncbi:hypothetical protein MLD38_019273 [Melastoma candidum]|uniref:Uncharacterized protein n=1 Tax=Melastoma candidum TaxID=119954 RepID=A0ACB9QVX3_9MYRT|nr:hypothetical protein MLD38_019273 [Melastoma candidum]
MPSAAAKRRKAAQKKKNKMAAVEEGVDAPLGVDSQVPEAAAGVPEGDDDLKTREERDSDSSGETGSPASQDLQYSFGQAVEECEKGDAGRALSEAVDESVLEAIDVVELEINDKNDIKDCVEKGGDAANGCQNPVSEVIDELDDKGSLPVQHGETNGNTHDGDVDDGVEKVYPVLEDLDSPHPSAKTNGGFHELSFPLESQNKNVVVGDGDALDDCESMLLANGSVEIMNGAEKEDDSQEKIIDGHGLELPRESDNFAEEVKTDLIAELSLPNESTTPVDLLPEATSLEEATVTSIADLASPLKELDDSRTVLKEQKEGLLSAVQVISGVDMLSLTKNEADDKLIPVSFDEAGTPKDGSESFTEDDNMCNDATLANNDTGSFLKENSVAKLENGPDTTNLPANGDVAALKENEHGDVLITGDDIAQNGSSKEKNDDLEGAYDNIDSQIVLPKAAVVVRKTSWMGCCGLFDVITGSVR